MEHDRKPPDFRVVSKRLKRFGTGKYREKFQELMAKQPQEPESTGSNVSCEWLRRADME
jgi:hypothetical protein